MSSTKDTTNALPAFDAKATATNASQEKVDGDVIVVAASPVVSGFIKMSDGSRTRADAVATVSRNGNKLYLKDRYDNFLIVLEFEYEEDAEAELHDVNEQLDRYEAARGSRTASRPNSYGKRKLHRR